MSNTNLNEKANKVLEIARRMGVQTNYFFETTFDRYSTQLTILARLKEIIDTEGMMVEKEYVRDRKNIYTNPAINEYNKTATAANQTVQTLIKIVKDLAKTTGEGEEDIISAMSSLIGNE